MESYIFVEIKLSFVFEDFVLLVPFLVPLMCWFEQIYGDARSTKAYTEHCLGMVKLPMTGVFHIVAIEPIYHEYQMGILIAC